MGNHGWEMMGHLSGMRIEHLFDNETGYEWKRCVIIWTLMGHNMGNYLNIIGWEIIGYGKSLGN